MRTRERLIGIQRWIDRELCEGRIMKCPDEDMDVTKIRYQRPRVYLGWQPMRPDESGMLSENPLNVCPGILVMPSAGRVKYVEQQRFDTYNHIRRPQDFGQAMNVDILFSVYEPGVRLPGFVESAEEGHIAMDHMTEGTEEGLFTLFDWMDDCVYKLLGVKNIPGTDLVLQEANTSYSLYTDQNYVVDKRPIYYGFVHAEFMGYAEEAYNEQIDKLLR